MTDVLSAEAFAELLEASLDTSKPTAWEYYAMPQASNAYAALLARYTALEQQLREARAEVERLRTAFAKARDGYLDRYELGIRNAADLLLEEMDIASFAAKEEGGQP